MKALTVVYEWSEDGWWVSDIPSVKGCHSQGRTLAQARRNVRGALSGCWDEGWDEKKAAAVEFIDDVRLPAAARAVIARRENAIRRLETAADDVEATSRQAVAALTDSVRLTVREAGELLGLSPQRVHQIAHAGAPPAGKRRDRRVVTAKAARRSKKAAP